MNSLISVVIPVYNVEKYICRCLDSVLKQTYHNVEIILINDGSTDNSGNICKDYQKKDARITLIHQDNQGLSVARNAGIDIAKGEYITFIDSDDCIAEDYLEQLVGALEDNNADISICGNVRFQDDFQNKIPCKNFDGVIISSGRDACKEIYTSKNKRAEYVVAWGKLYKRELFLEERYPVGRLHEDQFLTYRLFWTSSKVAEIGDCLYGYYQNANGIMGSPFSIRRYDEVIAHEEAIDFFEENEEYEIPELIRVRKNNLLAEYSIKARCAGIYKKVPKKYKMNILKAASVLKKSRGIDSYEYFMFQYYPGLVKVEARLRKIKRIITRTDN